MNLECHIASREAARHPASTRLIGLHRIAEARAMQVFFPSLSPAPTNQCRHSGTDDKKLPSRIAAPPRPPRLWIISLLMVKRVLLPLGLWAIFLMQHVNANTTVLFVDCSGSMQGPKSTAAKEGAKLMVAMAEEGTELVIVAFNDMAAAQKFSMARDREAAKRWIDTFRIDGSTDYLAALQAAQLPAGAQGIFLSDGEHNAGPAIQVLDFLKAHAKGRLHTISVGCPAGSEAESLLTQMAAITGGSFARVEDSEALVRKIVEIAVHTGQYRTYRPHEDTVSLKGCSGRILAFGYDSIPTVESNPPFSGPVYRHHADLPENVDLASIDLPGPTDVTLRATQKRFERGRLGDVHRNDQPLAKTEFHTSSGQVAAGEQLRASVHFTDRQGTPIPANPNLAAKVQLLDSSQRVLDQVLAKPSPDNSAYQAQLKVPDQPGPLTVRTKTAVRTPEGQQFIATEDRTVVVAKAYTLTATPVPLQATGKTGRFQCQLTIAIPEAPGVTATFAAELAENNPGLRLLSTASAGQTLTLDFEAIKPGTYRGSLLVRGTAELLTKTLEVPYVFTIEQHAVGLALPASREIDLGTVTADCGPREAVLRIPGLDEDPASYDVETRDLAGRAAAIALQAAPTVIRPSKGSPAELRLSFNVGSLPSGAYQGALVIRPCGSSADRRWETKLRLSISEPLSASPVDAGTVEVGRIVTRTLTLSNLGTSGVDAVTVTPPVTITGPAGETRDVTVTLAGDVGMVGPNQSKQLSLKIAVSPLMALRGAFQGQIRIRRGGTDAVTAPFSIKIVSEGQGPSPLVVAPESIELAGTPGEVAQAQLRIKLEAGGGEADEVAISAASFRDGQDAPAEVTAAFQWPDGAKLVPNGAVTAKAFFLGPKRPGTYRGTLAIRSQGNGTKSVPVTLNIQ